MASAPVGSCFSATISPRLPSKLSHGGADVVLRLVCPRGCRISSLTHFSKDSTSLVLPVAPRAGRPHRSTFAAVVQEETAATTEEEEGEPLPAAEEEQGEEGDQQSEAAAPPRATSQNTKLYFGNLPYNCDSAQLAGIIQEYASPEMVEVLYDRETGRSRGFAFVTMSTVEDCQAVINNLDRSQYGGRTMRVNFSDKPKPKAPLYPESEFKLFVGNLSWSVTSESLTQMFQDYGNVVGARVLYDGDTGRSRGYGFVCYSAKEEMENALQTLNGVELEGRAMRISLALGKKS